MLINVLTSLPALLLCLLFQAVFVAVGVRQYARFRDRAGESNELLRSIGILSAVMLLMLVGNFIQMGDLGDAVHGHRRIQRILHGVVLLQRDVRHAGLW